MWNWISKIEELRRQGTPFVMTTVTQVTGSTPRETGAKMIALPKGQFFGTIGGGHLEQLVLNDAQKVMNSGLAQVTRYPLGAKTGQCCGGVTEILFEPVHCGPQLYVFGAGHVGQAVCKSIIGTPFTVHLIDERPDWIQSTQIPSEVIRHPVEWDLAIDEILWDENKTYIVIMTHRHDTDQEILTSILEKPAKYLGLIGSDSKWKRFQQRMLTKGTDPSLFARVRSPIGIPIGGKAPQEVAISLTAELLQIHYGKK